MSYFLLNWWFPVIFSSFCLCTGSFNSWKVSVWCCTSHRGILECYFWRRCQVSIIQHLRCVWHFSHTLLFFYRQQQSYTTVFYLEIDLGLSSLTSVAIQSCSVYGSQAHRQCVENSFFHFVFLQIDMEVHRKCISLEKHGSLTLFKLEFLISSTSFVLTGWQKCQVRRKMWNDADINLNAQKETYKNYFSVLVLWTRNTYFIKYH